jgi:hypothetical protein
MTLQQRAFAAVFIGLYGYVAGKYALHIKAGKCPPW